jgi:hypothetical protein
VKRHPAHVWCWLAWLAMYESDALAYAEVRLPWHGDRIRELDETADAFVQRAKRACGGELPSGLWEAAIERFSTVEGVS